MKTILIRYNSFTQTTTLNIDGKAQEADGGRFQEFVLKHPLDRWLAAGVKSYQRWDGFLLELMELLNEDKLVIHFEGTQEDGDRFCRELPRQHRAVEDRGFDPELYVLKVQAWDLTGIQASLMEICDRMEENLITAGSHKRLLLFKKLLSMEPGVEQLKLCRTMALEVIRETLDYCNQVENPTVDLLTKKHFWVAVSQDIHRIFQSL